MTPEQMRAIRSGQKMPPGAQQQMMMVPQAAGPVMPPGGEMMMDPSMMMMDPSMYNPMLAGTGGPNVQTMNRWLTPQLPKTEDLDRFWVTETAMIEELAKANLTKDEYNWFVREYAEIEAIAGGDGNEKWVRSRQRKFLMRLEATRSRPDNKEIGVRDATLLLTQTINQKSDVKMPSENLNPVNNGGFFGILRGNR